MNRLGMMIDLSHPSKGANLEAIRLSKAPAIASHSAVRALANVSRNMDDEQLLALKKNGGVIQIVGLASFLKIDSAERTAALAKLRDEFGIASGTGAAAGAVPTAAGRGARAGAPTTPAPCPIETIGNIPAQGVAAAPGNPGLAAPSAHKLTKYAKRLSAIQATN